MSTMIMAACWPLQMPPTPKAVLISLADNANDQGVCWPSITTIAERTCFSERAVQNAIKWLEAEQVVMADRSNGRHTRYTIVPANYLATNPRSRCTPQEMHPAADAPVPPQQMHPHPRSRCTPPPQEVRQPPQEVPSNRKEPSRTIKSTRGSKQNFSAWVQALGEQDAILATDPIFDWATQAGIPEDWIALAWEAFCRLYGADGVRRSKVYTDWRAVFRNAVEGDWLHLWRCERDGSYSLTTAGAQLRRQMDAACGELERAA